MIDIDTWVRLRYGMRRGSIGKVIDTAARDEKIHYSSVRFCVMFEVGDIDWYEPEALEELAEEAEKMISAA
ncbi:MAG: hypothetical protein WKF84_01435 [Pyrinomonadaceae bacterium]